jgi:hypothetical protein
VSEFCLEGSRFSRWRPAIEREYEGFARGICTDHLNFGRPFLRSRQNKGGRDRDTRVRNQAKSTIRMRIRGEAVCMNYLYGRKKSNQQQANDSENFVSEEPETRIGPRLKH